MEYGSGSTYLTKTGSVHNTGCNKDVVTLDVCGLSPIMTFVAYKVCLFYVSKVKFLF